MPYSKDPLEEDKFRYIRILTPSTRRNKWMYQTWHHLPNYHDNNPVNNRSAIYTEPHKITPRHFTIPPRLGGLVAPPHVENRHQLIQNYTLATVMCGVSDTDSTQTLCQIHQTPLYSTWTV